MLNGCRGGQTHAACLSTVQRKGVWCFIQGHMSVALKASAITLPALIAWSHTMLLLNASLSLLALVHHARQSLQQTFKHGDMQGRLNFLWASQITWGEGKT
jgi:hypothetical protein